MVHEVCGLTEEEFLVVVLALDDEFDCFLTYLLCDLIETSSEEVVCI